MRLLKRALASLSAQTHCSSISQGLALVVRCIPDGLSSPASGMLCVHLDKSPGPPLCCCCCCCCCCCRACYRRWASNSAWWWATLLARVLLWTWLSGVCSGAGTWRSSKWSHCAIPATCTPPTDTTHHDLVWAMLHRPATARVLKTTEGAASMLRLLQSYRPCGHNHRNSFGLHTVAVFHAAGTLPACLGWCWCPQRSPPSHATSWQMQTWASCCALLLPVPCCPRRDLG
jgi:hypothetical protein